MGGVSFAVANDPLPTEIVILSAAKDLLLFSPPEPRQEAVPMEVGDEVHCRRSEFSVRLLRLRPNGLFNVLRSKLKWGER